MRHELDIVQEKRDLEERNLYRLQRRLKHEEGTLQVTKDAILSLDKMKVLLDYRMMVENEESQKKQLSAMRVDTVMLLKDKSRALKAIQSVKSSYDTAISDKREILFLHHLLEHVHETLLEWQNGMNSSIWAPSEILLACVDHESKADAVRKTQQLRFRTLMDTKKRGSTASGARISDMEPGDTSDDDSGGPSSEEIIVLKRKLAEITAEKEEFKAASGRSIAERARSALGLVLHDPVPVRSQLERLLGVLFEIGGYPGIVWLGWQARGRRLRRWALASPWRILTRLEPRHRRLG